jgi:uncharacterized protein
MSTPRWHTREDSGLHLDRHLRWFHDGVPIEHPNIIEAFNQGLRVDDSGRAVLVFGNDWCFVTFEKCLFSVVAVDVSPTERRLSVRLSDRTAEWIQVDTLTEDDDGALLVKVKDRRAWARFTHSAQVQLAPFLEETPSGIVVTVQGKSWDAPHLKASHP